MKKELTSWDDLDFDGYTDPMAFAVQPVIINHFYKGAAGYDSVCEKCDQPKHHHSHFRNRGVICDNASGPCACGSTHKKS